MKLSGKLALFACSVFFAAKSFAQCIPDSAMQVSQGIFPEQLPAADLNVAYSQVVQFKAPLDTNIYYQPLGTSVSAHIDSLRIVEVMGLPPGISYQCNNASCMIKGGETGCLLISGTTSDPGNHPLKVVIRTSAKIVGTPPFPDIPQVVTDTNMRYNLFVNWPTGLFDAKASQTLRLYPNPASQKVYLEADLAHERSVIATVYDLTGRIVLTQSLEAVSSQQSIDISMLPKGIYSLSVSTRAGVLQQKLLVK